MAEEMKNVSTETVENAAKVEKKVKTKTEAKPNFFVTVCFAFFSALAAFFGASVASTSA